MESEYKVYFKITTNNSKVHGFKINIKYNNKKILCFSAILINVDVNDIQKFVTSVEKNENCELTFYDYSGKVNINCIDNNAIFKVEISENGFGGSCSSNVPITQDLKNAFGKILDCKKKISYN